MSRFIMLAVLLTGIAMANPIPGSCTQARDEVLREGIRALRKGDFTRAQSVFSELVKQDPSATNINYLAMAEAGAGNFLQAIVYFRQAIRLGDHSASIHYNLGITYLKIGHFAAGIGELHEALALEPRSAPITYALGVSFLKAGRSREAIPYLESAQKLLPRSPEVLANLARAQFDAKETTSALHTVDNAVNTSPNNSKLLVTLATLCLKHRQIHKGRDLLETAYELTSQNPSIGLLLAKSCLLAGESNEALVVLKSLPPGIGEPGEVMLLMGEAQALTGNLNAADSDISVALSANPKNVRYLTVSAWVDQVLGRHTEALGVLERARKLDGHNPKVLYRMAVSYAFLGEFRKAAQACKQVFQLVPNYEGCMLVFGIIKIGNNDFQGAESVLKQGTALYPDNALFHSTLGDALLKDGKLAQSKRELDQAINLDPRSAQSYFWRGSVFAREGDRREAIADMETAVAISPHYRAAYAKLAQFYFADGQVKKAKAMMGKETKELNREHHEDILRMEKALLGVPNGEK